MTTKVWLLIFLAGMLAGVRFAIVATTIAAGDLMLVVVGLTVAIPTGWVGMSQLSRR